MELAARTLGAEGAALPVVRDFARGAGTAALLRALPALRARGRDPLPPGVARSMPSPATASPRSPAPGAAATGCRAPRAAALLPGWQADRVLAKAPRPTRRPRSQGASRSSEARARAGLMWRALSGRW